MAEAKFAEKHALAELIRNEPQPLPDGPFRVIVADPPWPYAARSDDATHRARNPYPDMTLDDIRALPVAARAATECVLWLWTTNAFMRDAFTVLDAWASSTHKTILTWARIASAIRRSAARQTEHCLFASRGKPVVTLDGAEYVARRGRGETLCEAGRVLCARGKPMPRLEARNVRPRSARRLDGLGRGERTDAMKRKKHDARSQYR